MVRMLPVWLLALCLSGGCKIPSEASEGTPLPGFLADVLDNAHVIFRADLESHTPCPGQACQPDSAGGSHCACPVGLQLQTQATGWYAGSGDPSSLVVLYNKGITGAPIDRYLNGSRGEVIVVAQREAPSPDGLGEVCGVDAAQPLLHAVGSYDVWVLRKGAPNAQPLGCLVHADLQSVETPSAWESNLAGCERSVEALENEIRESKRRVVTRPASALTARPAALDQATYVVERGPFWCAWPEAAATSSSGGTGGP